MAWTRFSSSCIWKIAGCLLAADALAVAPLRIPCEGEEKALEKAFQDVRECLRDAGSARGLCPAQNEAVRAAELRLQQCRAFNSKPGSPHEN